MLCYYRFCYMKSLQPRSIAQDVTFTPSVYARNHWSPKHFFSIKTFLILHALLWLYDNNRFGKKLILKWASSSTVKLVSHLSITKPISSWPKLKLVWLNHLKKIKHKLVKKYNKGKPASEQRNSAVWNGLFTNKSLELKEGGFWKAPNNPLTRSRSYLSFLFDINYLKKERLYTKLKYSRSPAYDIVSGGSAALFAGFIGFLISEKFGIELVDSGDFYIVFMYAVFLSFACRPFLKIISKTGSMWSVVSFNHLFDYLNVVFIFILRLLRQFKNLFRNLWQITWAWIILESLLFSL